MYIKHVSSCRGSYALPLMGAFVALCLSACQKPGDAVSTPESPSGGGDDEYVTFVLEDENGNTLRAGDGLTPGSTNPLVGEYNYRSQAPNALAYIDLPGTAENGFRMPKTQFKEEGASLPVYLNENAVVVAGRYRFSQDDADKGTTQPLMHETFGKHLTDPDPAPLPLFVPGPTGGDVPNMVYVTLDVGGPKNTADFLLETYLEEKPLTVRTMRTQKSRTDVEKVYATRTVRHFNYNTLWMFNVQLVNPFFWVGYGLARADGADNPFWITEEEPAYNPLEYTSKTILFDYPLEIGPTYVFKLTPLTNKPLPEYLKLEIEYDEIQGSFENFEYFMVGRRTDKMGDACPVNHLQKYNTSLKKEVIIGKSSETSNEYIHKGSILPGKGKLVKTTTWTKWNDNGTYRMKQSDEFNAGWNFNSGNKIREDHYHLTYSAMVIKNIRVLSPSSVAVNPFIPSRQSIHFDSQGHLRL